MLSGIYKVGWAVETILNVVGSTEWYGGRAGSYRAGSGADLGGVGCGDAGTSWSSIAES